MVIHTGGVQHLLPFPRCCPALSGIGFHRYKLMVRTAFLQNVAVSLLVPINFIYLRRKDIHTALYRISDNRNLEGIQTVRVLSIATSYPNGLNPARVPF